MLNTCEDKTKKCMEKGCDEGAEFVIGQRRVVRQNLYLCKRCLGLLYAKIAKEIVPKSPQNFIEKAEKSFRNKRT